MSQASIKLLIPLESLFDSLSGLSLQEKRQIRAWLDEQIAQAEIRENRTDYLAKDLLTTKERLTLQDFLGELEKLTLTERFAIVETTLRLIREDLQPMDQPRLTWAERKRQLVIATQALLSTYTTDNDLTSFTALEKPGFCEKPGF